jgi:hypothetical protein
MQRVVETGRHHRGYIRRFTLVAVTAGYRQEFVCSRILILVTLNTLIMIDISHRFRPEVEQPPELQRECAVRLPKMAGITALVLSRQDLRMQIMREYDRRPFRRLKSRDFRDDNEVIPRLSLGRLTAAAPG